MNLEKFSNAIREFNLVDIFQKLQCFKREYRIYFVMFVNFDCVIDFRESYKFKKKKKRIGRERKGKKEEEKGE